jgi:hypothetical protein
LPGAARAWNEKNTQNVAGWAAAGNQNQPP